MRDRILFCILTESLPGTSSVSYFPFSAKAHTFQRVTWDAVDSCSVDWVIPCCVEECYRSDPSVSSSLALVLQQWRWRIETSMEHHVRSDQMNLPCCFRSARLATISTVRSRSFTWLAASIRCVWRFFTTNRTTLAFCNWILCVDEAFFPKTGDETARARSWSPSEENPIWLARSAGVNRDLFCWVTEQWPCSTKISHARCWPCSAACNHK